jgi:hypothetical protein
MTTGPDSKYMMQWAGEWHAVVDMFDHRNVPTTLALHAAKAVLYISPDEWVAVAVVPGEIVERSDRDPRLRTWESL